MKKASLILFTAFFGTFSYAQETDSIGLEGDNLDLNGVLELFKESKDVEDFEKKLNTESNGVNNLDLNEDGEVDYIRVVDYPDSNSHSLALQVPVTESESQDVAVIEMEEIDKETVNLQVIGDSDLYGEEYMLEPADEKNPSIVVNVNSWKPIRYIYGKRYVTWNSPYRWGNYPTWHRPWSRVTWAVYRPRVAHYHRPYYRYTNVRRCHRAHSNYRAHHVHSPHFQNNHKSIGAKSKNNNAGVKQTTTVKKSSNGTITKKQTTTVKKNPQANPNKKKVAPVKKAPATKRKRPGGTKEKSKGSGKKG